MTDALASPSPEPAPAPRGGSSAWTDLGLTLPIFVGYHLGVIFLPVRNAADMVTRELVALADHNLLAYGGLTLAIGAVFVGILVVLGRGHALKPGRFLFIAIEGVVYAVAMRMIASWVVGELYLGAGGGGPFAGFVMSLGAGFYEEIVFRVGIFGVGVMLMKVIFPLIPPIQQKLMIIGWAVVAAAVFSGWHYVGALGDPFDLRSFTFRWVCGLVFTAIYAFRGFAPAVWTHTIYDVWVLVF